MSIDGQFNLEEWDELATMECKCETRYKYCAEWCDACEGYTGKCNGCKQRFTCAIKFDQHNCITKKEIKGEQGEINGKN